jgi:16S rRNA (guanine(966)-N(2))-methyltransferase RsmD
MALRVIAGRCKGRRLATPDWAGLRPTSDRLRGTVFDILGARVDGACVLDAFAGTGAVGIEAISRGAAHVTFVEHDRRALALIARNLRGCGITGGYTVLPARWPATLSAAGPVFDIGWLDPPYDIDELGDALAAACRATRSSGLVVCEHAARREPPTAVGEWGRVRVVRAGDSALSFYVAAGPPASEGPDR